MRRHAIPIRQHKRIGYLSDSDKDIELRNTCDVLNVQIDSPENNDKKDQQNKDKNELETNQPEPSTLCTTDGQH